jgi:hypothetical protein
MPEHVRGQDVRHARGDGMTPDDEARGPMRERPLAAAVEEQVG